MKPNKALGSTQPTVRYSVLDQVEKVSYTAPNVPNRADSLPELGFGIGVYLGNVDKWIQLRHIIGGSIIEFWSLWRVVVTWSRSATESRNYEIAMSYCGKGDVKTRVGQALKMWSSRGMISERVVGNVKYWSPTDECVQLFLRSMVINDEVKKK